MEKLEQIAMNDEVWATITRNMLDNGCSIDEQTELYGNQIASCVISDSLSVRALRQCVKWANRLDRETVIETGGNGDLTHLKGNDYAEAVARRVMHGSTKTALELVKSSDHRNTYRARNAKFQREPDVMPGMGRLESKDLELNGFVQSDEHGTLSARKAL